MHRRFWGLLLVVTLNLLLLGSAKAGALRYCSATTPLTAAQQDKILQFAAIAKAELEASGAALAVLARSGLDLSYFNQRYSHAGISLQASQNTPWSVRQLYYDCVERKPRIFDQGLAGFVMGTDDPDKGFVSMLFLPKPQASALERDAKDNALSLRLLASQYSANAYAFSTLYQNCNQWLAELLAVSFARLSASEHLRTRAQAWLAEQGYAATTMRLVWRPLLWVTAFSDLVHIDDHPQDDIEALRMQVSMPNSIEAFVKATLPGARRVEMCRTPTHVVIRRGWDALEDNCTPSTGDQVIQLD